jgi:putative transposase
MFHENIEISIRDICLEISQRYEITFLEIGFDGDHAHFLIQSVPTYSPTKLARTIKSLTARELFSRHPSLRKTYWSGHFWTSGYFINSVSRYGSEEAIRRYVRDQGKSDSSYRELYRHQLSLFEEESEMLEIETPQQI